MMNSQTTEKSPLSKKQGGSGRNLKVGLLVGTLCVVVVVAVFGGKHMNGERAESHVRVEKQGRLGALDMMETADAKTLSKPHVNACLAVLMNRESGQCFGRSTPLSDAAKLHFEGTDDSVEKSKLTGEALLAAGRNLNCEEPDKVNVAFADNNVKSKAMMIMLHFKDGSIVTADVNPCQVTALYASKTSNGKLVMERDGMSKETSQTKSGLAARSDKDCLPKLYHCKEDHQCCSNDCVGTYWYWTCWRCCHLWCDLCCGVQIHKNVCTK